VSDRNDAIIKKIKGLLAIANDNESDEESQSAFLMAQKLMMKYNISLGEVEDVNDGQSINEGQVTAHKKLYWWEKQLANIMSENFRVKNFINSKWTDSSAQRKRAVVFLGYENDVALAKEMYLLAYEAITSYSNQFVDEYYESMGISRTKQTTNNIKNSYMRGFLSGLEEKFEEQVASMKQEYGLMVLVPKEVVEEYDRVVTGKATSYKIPPVEELIAYRKGFDDGNKIDYTKSTIDGVI
jgi:Protein of unknown function (DUF2786)